MPNSQMKESLSKKKGRGMTETELVTRLTIIQGYGLQRYINLRKGLGFGRVGKSLSMPAVVLKGGVQLGGGIGSRWPPNETRGYA